MQYYLMEYTDLFPYVALLQPNSLLTLWLNQDLFLTLVDHKQFISYSLESFVDFSFQQPQGYHTPSLVRINSYSTMLCPLNIKFVLGVPQGVACIALIVAMSQCKQLYSAIFAVCHVKLL